MAYKPNRAYTGNFGLAYKKNLACVLSSSWASEPTGTGSNVHPAPLSRMPWWCERGTQDDCLFSTPYRTGVPNLSLTMYPFSISTD